MKCKTFERRVKKIPKCWWHYFSFFRSGNLNSTNPLGHLLKRKSFLKVNFPSAAQKISHVAQSPALKNLPVKNQTPDDSPSSIEITTLMENDDYQIQSQSIAYPLACPKCSTNIPDLEVLKIHMKDHWTIDNLCPICDRHISATKPGNFIPHLKSHMQEKKFVCKICNYTCPKRCRLNYHLKVHGKRLWFHYFSSNSFFDCCINKLFSICHCQCVISHYKVFKNCV